MACRKRTDKERLWRALSPSLGPALFSPPHVGQSVSALRGAFACIDGGGEAMEELDKQILQEVARVELQTLSEIRQISWEQHSSGYKWLTSSLLAINGGAAFAIMSADRFKGADVRWPIILFVVGILLALLSARTNQWFVMRNMPGLQWMSGYWVSVLVSGVRDDDGEAALMSRVRTQMRGAWLGQAAAWASVFAFVGGIAVAGLLLR